MSEMIVAINVKIRYCMLIMKFGLLIQVYSSDEELPAEERPVARPITARHHYFVSIIQMHYKCLP